MISQEMRDKARRVNLIAYCQSKRYEVKRCGCDYHVPELGSVYIKANAPFAWYDFKTEKGGNAIDFAMQIMGLDFKEAVEDLLGPLPEIAEEPKVLHEYNMTFADNQKRVIAFLCKKRGLSYEIVTQMIRDNKLKQDTYGNCVFLIRDESGMVVSAEIRGTTDTKYNRQPVSSNGYGFILYTHVRVDWIIYVESAIDLLSLYELYKCKLQNCLLVSMQGLKTKVVERYHTMYPDARQCVAVDSDKAGKEFAERVGLPHRLPESPYKDWNDMLRGQKELLY